MYNIISAIAKPISGGGRWKAIAVGELAISFLFANYSKVLITLSNPYLPENVSLDLDTIRPKYGGLSISFNQFLTDLGEGALETSPVIKKINTRYVRYADMMHAGYAATPIHALHAVDSQHNINDKTNLRLTRANTDYGLFYKSCLVLVNGYYHTTDYDSHGIYVKDAMVTSRKSGENHVGAISFRELGELSFIPITPDMLVPITPESALKEGCYVKLGVDVSNKSVMLVLGGYLHLPGSETFSLSSDKLALVKFNNYPMIDRYYESRHKIDLSSLKLESTDRNESQVSVSNILSDEVLKAYMSLSQSFFVVLNNPDVFVEQTPLLAGKLPGMYVSYTPPIYPVINRTGRAMNYWYKSEVGQYAINCVDAGSPRRIYDKTSIYDQYSVDASQYTAGDTVNSPAHFLMIGSDL